MEIQTDKYHSHHTCGGHEIELGGQTLSLPPPIPHIWGPHDEYLFVGGNTSTSTLRNMGLKTASESLTTRPENAVTQHLSTSPTSLRHSCVCVCACVRANHYTCTYIYTPTLEEEREKEKGKGERERRRREERREREKEGRREREMEGQGEGRRGGKRERERNELRKKKGESGGVRVRDRGIVKGEKEGCYYVPVSERLCSPGEW